MMLPITVTVDASQARFHGLLEWAGRNEAALPDALLMGYQAIEAGVDRMVSAEVERRCGPSLKEEIDRRAKQMSAGADAQAAMLAETLHNERLAAGARVAGLQDALAYADHRANEMRSALDAEVNRRCEEAARVSAEQLSILRDAIMSGNSGELSTLRSELTQARDELKAKAAELRALKATNHGKGASGENALCDLLKRHFPRMSVRMSGSESHSGDLHLQDPASGDFVLFESKNKDRVTPGDVAKFYRDVDETGTTTINGGRCVGAVFVSLRSRGIPGKGDVALELRGGVPVMFVSFDNEEAATELLPSQAHVIVGLCFAMSCSRAKTQTDGKEIEGVLQEISTVIAILHRNMQRVTKLRAEHLASMQRVLMDMERENGEVIKLMGAVLVRHGFVQENAPKDFPCRKCGKKYKSQSALTKQEQ